MVTRASAIRLCRAAGAVNNPGRPRWSIPAGGDPVVWLALIPLGWGCLNEQAHG